MRVISVNVGMPRPVAHEGRAVQTGIYKRPVKGPLAVRRLNLDGDGQADLRHHGGVDKAVYAFDQSGYAYWQATAPGKAYGPGFFGENLTLEGLPETDVAIGDVFRVGTAVVQVTQPRVPCFKLGIRVGDPAFVAQFLEGRRTGFYLRVLEEGEVQPGGAITRIERPEPAVSVRDLVEAYFFDGPRATLEGALRVPALSASWRERLEKRLDTGD